MEKIRLSYYTIPVILSKDNDKLVLIHGNTGAIDVISTRLYSSLNNINGNILITSTFSKNNVDKVYSAIENYLEENKIIKRPQIVLFGGEPLLTENRKIVEYIVYEGVKRWYTFSAITNRYDLDDYIKVG